MNGGNPECEVINITIGAFHFAAAVAGRSVRVTNSWLAIDLYTGERNVDACTGLSDGGCSVRI
jgi:hypothetical protein